MMKIIIRHLGETLYIGEDVEVMILAIKGDEVRLGIVAPKSIPVQPKEAPRKKS